MYSINFSFYIICRSAAYEMELHQFLSPKPLNVLQVSLNKNSQDE